MHADARRCTGHGEKVSRKQEQAIVALTTCGTILEAAQTAGVDPSTLRRWLRLPAFAERYRTARRDVLSDAIGELTGATSQAVRSLRALLTCGNPSIECRAAVAVLDLALRAAVLADVEARLTDLEARIT